MNQAAKPPYVAQFDRCYGHAAVFPLLLTLAQGQVFAMDPEHWMAQ